MKITNRQAIDAQLALANLISLNLPVKVSWEVAQLSVEVDAQVEMFTKVRDALIKNYQIKILAGDTAKQVKLETSLDGDKDEAIKEFTSKVDELSVTKTADIKTIVHLPDDINVQPNVLKPLMPFLKMSETDGQS